MTWIDDNRIGRRAREFASGAKPRAALCLEISGDPHCVGCENGLTYGGQTLSPDNQRHHHIASCLGRPTADTSGIPGPNRLCRYRPDAEPDHSVTGFPTSFMPRGMLLAIANFPLPGPTGDGTLPGAIASDWSRFRGGTQRCSPDSYRDRGGHQVRHHPGRRGHILPTDKR
jgi:hypothetical protein